MFVCKAYTVSMKTVGVLMGGPSSEHDISLMSGRNVIKALHGRYHVHPVYVTHTGEWLAGEKQEWLTPAEALRGADVVFNAMHGEYGEDGKVQGILDSIRIPYVGSGVFGSALAMHKDRSGQVLKKAGLHLPRSFVVKKDNINESEVVKKAVDFSAPPWVIKPLRRGSSVGVSMVHTFEGLLSAFKRAFQYDDHAMLQKYVKGRELTCGVLENFGGEKYFALPPVEIIPPENRFFDYQTKYDGSTKEICPADFYGDMLRHIRETAVKAHKALHLQHYSRVDMILDGTKLYVLEVNSSPGFTSESLYPKAAKAAGLEFQQLLDHLIRLAVT